MKLTKTKLQQIIQEELAALAEEDAELAAALMGKAGLPRSAQDTKVDRPDPVMPQDLGAEDDPEREEEELPEISQQEAINAFIEAFIKFPEDKQMSWRSDEKKLNYVLNQFIRSYRMGAIDGSAEDLDGIWSALNEAWEGDAEIEQTGEYSGKSTKELCAMKNRLMKKEKRTDAEQKKVRQINFAIRSKQKGPKFGKVKC